MRVGLAGLAVLLMTSAVAAEDCRPLDMYAAKLRQDRNTFEVQVFQVLAEKDALIATLQAELAKLTKKPEPGSGQEKKP